METFTDDALRACLAPHLPAPETEAADFERITTGKFNTSYTVRTDRGSYVLRIAPPSGEVFLFYERDMMRQEPGIHRLLRDRTRVPVAGILAFDDSRDVLDRNFLLMERLPGTPLSQAVGVDASRTLRQTGRALAETHAQTADAYGYIGEHHPMEPQPTWAEAFRVMWRKLLDDIRGVGFYDDDQVASLAAIVEDRIDLFDRDVPARLLHMDIWSQNLLVDPQGNLEGIVDWDRALWGDPEIEFAVLDYCGISEPPFWEGYGAERDTSPEAETRRVVYLLYELQKYIVIRAGRNDNPAGARRYKEQALQVVCWTFGDDVV